MFLNSSEIKQTKVKKKLAPNIKSQKEEKLPTATVEDTDDFEYSDDLLNEIFADKPEPKEKTETIDLDDWIPPKLKEYQSIISETVNTKGTGTPPVLANVKKNLQKSTSQSILTKSENFTNRKESMFTSKEYEEDSTLRLRFLKREMPASRLKEALSALEMVPLLNALKCTGKNWFTFGVVSDRGELKKGGSGRIDVTDLTSEPYIVKFLLFNSAYSSLSKLNAGTIVCLLNPTKAKPYNGKEALVVNDTAQVVIAGTSRDFGLCSGRKKSGGSCTAVVNLHICRYCKYHAVTEYRQQNVAKTLRAAAVGAGIGTKSMPARAGLWNAQASKASSLNPAKRNVIQINRDKDRLNKLNTSSSSSSSVIENKNTLPSSPVVGSWPKFDPAGLKSPKKNVEKRKSSCLSSPDDSSSLHISKHLNLSEMSHIPSRCSSPQQKISCAKRKALQYARESGGIAKEKPKQKLVEKKEEAEGPKGFSDEFMAAMKAKPHDVAILEKAEAEERDQRFERLKVVEEISEKLVATHEVPVRAIRCLVCEKNYHQMPLQCVMNKHKCRVVSGTKRFFECNSCRARTTTLERFPAAECSKCGVWSWKKAGVAAERVCSVANPLSVRGLEEKYVGSVVNDPNLSLLVPDKE